MNADGDFWKLLPNKVVSSVTHSHAACQSTTCFHAAAALPRLHQRRVDGIADRHAVDDGAIGLKTAAIDKADRLRKEVCLFPTALGEQPQVIRREVDVKMRCHIEPERDQRNTRIIYELRCLWVNIDVPFALRRIAGCVEEGIFV